MPRDDQPDLRLTVGRRRALHAAPFGPWLADTGPSRAHLAARSRGGVTIADVHIVRDEEGNAAEAIVAVRAADRPERRAAIVRWAGDVGYARVWVGDDLVELEPSAVGHAGVRCPTCRAEWEDDSPEFWAAVLHDGFFPTICTVCGATMPQWTVSVASTAPVPPAPVGDPARVGES